MPFVYSTLSQDTSYNVYVKREGKTTHSGPLKPIRKILIAGGTGVADKKLVTPRGKATKVTQEDAELLMENKVFLMHMANKFVIIEDSNEDPEVIVDVGEMAPKDFSAPKTPEDFPKKNPNDENAEPSPQPTLNKKKK
jgi:hypothetical protein